MITIQDIFDAIEKAPPDKKLETAEEMLRQYEGDDKELIEPDILASACNQQTLEPR